MRLVQAHGCYPSRGLRRVQPGEVILGALTRSKMLTVFPGSLVIGNLVGVTSARSATLARFPSW